MASLPYVTSPGNIDKALVGIKQASVPESVSQDFVKTILKIPWGLRRSNDLIPQKIRANKS